MRRWLCLLIMLYAQIVRHFDIYAVERHVRNSHEFKSGRTRQARSL